MALSVQFEMSIWPDSAKQPVNVQFYDILVLQNHSKAFAICIDTQQCRGISMFLVSALAKKKKNAEATEFSAIIKTTFPRKRKNILLFKKEKKCCTQ